MLRPSYQGQKIMSRLISLEMKKGALRLLKAAPHFYHAEQKFNSC
jgi:hypothetical protein